MAGPNHDSELEYRGGEGPGYWSIDLALSRLIQLGSTRNLEIRLESFNVTNNFNWGNPATNLNQAQFGRITTNGGTPRIMQFGIKLRVLSLCAGAEAVLRVVSPSHFCADCEFRPLFEAPGRRSQRGPLMTIR